MFGIKNILELEGITLPNNVEELPTIQESLVSIFVNKIGSKLSFEALEQMNKEESFIYDLRMINFKLDMQKKLKKYGISFREIDEFNNRKTNDNINQKFLKILQDMIEASPQTPSFGDFCWPVEQNACFSFGFINYENDKKLSLFSFILQYTKNSKNFAIFVTVKDGMVNVSTTREHENDDEVNKHIQGWFRHGW